MRNVLEGSRINGAAEQPPLKVPLSTRGVLSALNQNTSKSGGRDELTFTGAVLAGTGVRGAVLRRDRLYASKDSCIHSLNLG